MFSDSHAHLEMAEFDRDRHDVVGRAGQAGVNVIVTVGTTEEDCLKAISLAGRYAGVYAAVGIHPHNAQDVGEDTFRLLRELARRDKVVAYGEIGLDFFHNHSPRQLQIARFGEQLDLAEELNLPIIIHCREAQREVMEMLEARRGGLGGVFHCFSGDPEMARRCLDLGYLISIPGTVTFPKAQHVREVVRYVGLAGLLLETDCPYLAPHPHRGKRNEPAFVVHVARAIGEILQTEPEEVGRVTSANCREVFRINADPSTQREPFSRGRQNP